MNANALNIRSGKTPGEGDPSSRRSSGGSLARSTGVSGRTLALLSMLAAALMPAFVLAPQALASMAGGVTSDKRTLDERLPAAFVEYWSAGDRPFSPDLQSLIDYWFRYHVAKAVIAAILLIVLVALGVLLWTTFTRGRALAAGTRAALASAGGFVSVLALLSLATVLANIQGAIAPFSSLLSMLPVGETDGRLASTLVHVREQLADSPSAAGQTRPALAVMISDFARYHLAMVWVGAIAALLLAGISVALWKRRARTEWCDRPARRVVASYGVLVALVSLLMIVVAVVNVTTAADPAPALLNFFEGAL